MKTLTIFTLKNSKLDFIQKVYSFIAYHHGISYNLKYLCLRNVSSSNKAHKRIQYLNLFFLIVSQEPMEWRSELGMCSHIDNSSQWFLSTFHSSCLWGKQLKLLFLWATFTIGKVTNLHMLYCSFFFILIIIYIFYKQGQ